MSTVHGSRVFVATTAMAIVAALAVAPAAFAQGEAIGADVSVTQTDTPDPVFGNSQLVYDVTVANSGPGLAIVGLNFDAPEGSAVTAAPRSCSVSSNGDVSCLVLPALVPGGSSEIEIVTIPRRVGTITAVANATVLLPQLDPNQANNVDEEETTVLQPIGPRNCRGREPTIVAGQDGGVVRGTKGDDVIVGLDGNDRIRGGGGNDRICGGEGDDVIKGGDGRDNLKGGAGDDEVNGGPRNDKIAGSAGVDELRGQKGRDSVRGGGGNDLVKAGPGDDRVTGGAGDDVGNGAGGDDRIAGHGGADELNGRSGDDTLIGGGGENALDGGPGKDSCRGGGTATRCERD